VRAAIAIYDVARALAVRHRREVIYRSPKPDNILFGDELRPYLVDFAFARYLRKAENTTERRI
jgi:serine/threonine protein kinase